MLRELGLRECADVRIGDTAKRLVVVHEALFYLLVSGRRGISGGEKKRVSIGIEMVTDPGLLLLDGNFMSLWGPVVPNGSVFHIEPTSGLDSSTAYSIMLLLKNLAQRGRTVICTIHSPSSKIFALFDRLLLMTEGSIVYMGPARQCLPFFQENGLICPPLQNPAEFCCTSPLLLFSPFSSLL